MGSRGARIWMAVGGVTIVMYVVVRTIPDVGGIRPDIA